jgi:hypothetical protein
MNLGLPNTFLGERVYLFASKNLIERSNTKCVLFVDRHFYCFFCGMATMYIL